MEITRTYKVDPFYLLVDRTHHLAAVDIPDVVLEKLLNRLLAEVTADQPVDYVRLVPGPNCWAVSYRVAGGKDETYRAGPNSNPDEARKALPGLVVDVLRRLADKKATIS